MPSASSSPPAAERRSGRRPAPRPLLFAALLSWAAGACSIAGPADPPWPLAPGWTAVRDLGPAEEHHWVVAAASGEYVAVEVEQRGLDVAVRLIDAGGGSLAWMDSPNGPYGPEIVSWIAQRAGSWRIEVASLVSETSTGQYAIRVGERRPAASADAPRVAAERAFAQAAQRSRLADRTTSLAAVADFERAAALFHQAGDPPREALALVASGDLLQVLGEPPGALSAYRRALDLLAAERDSASAYLQALAWRKAARVQTLLGEARAARELLERAATVLGDDYPLQQAEVRRQQAWVSLQLGDLQAALDAAASAYELAHGRNLANEARALTTLGFLAWQLGDIRQARERLEQALPLAREIAGPHPLTEGLVLHDLAWTYWLAGERDRATTASREALAVQRARGDRAGAAFSLATQADFEREAGRPAGAAALAGEALALARAAGSAGAELHALLALGRTRAMLGETGDAEQLCRQALAVSRRAGHREGAAAAATAIARLARDRGDLEGARALVAEALVGLETARGSLHAEESRIYYLASRREVYDLEVDLLMRLHAAQPGAGHHSEAFLASERSKARVLLDVLTRAGVEADSTAPGALALLSVERVQKHLLDEGTVLLEYALGSERSYLWRLTRTSLTSYELPPGPAIEAAVRVFLDLLSSPDRHLTARQRELAAGRLTAMLLAPALDGLPNSRLAIVPEGALCFLPWAALHGANLSSGESEAVPPALLATHEIVVLPSAATLAALRTRGKPRAAAGLAVLADPVFGPEDERLAPAARSRAATLLAEGPATEVGDEAGLPRLSRLPFSGAEAAAILASVAAGPTLAATGFDADRSTARRALEQFRVVHFATHALIDPRRPERSGIVFSLLDPAGEARDGFLDLRDLHALEPGADLVMLSACRTALGQEARGEGLLGLTRALLRGGVGRVGASLWEVEDEATAALMASFYRGLLTRGLPASAALREAQLAVRNEPRWREPYFWAGFVLYGDWR